MKIAYLQCPTGIAGDMCLGAIVDAGVPLEYLIENLSRLGIAQEYQLWTEQVHRNGLRATKFHVDLVYATGETVNPDTFNTFDHAAYDANESGLPVIEIAEQADSMSHQHPHSGGIAEHTHTHTDSDSHLHHSHSHPNHAHSDQHQAHPHHTHFPPIRHLPEIEQLILHARLPERATAWSLAVFRQLAVAEGAVHGVPPEQVHFHEVGATDALVDIIGTCLGLDWLGIDHLICSPLPTGGGNIRAAHGRLPVPSPAVLKLFELGQVPIYSNGIERELVTPTGAAIATTLAHHFGAPPTMTLQRVGLGAGSSEFALPNILRLWIGETEARAEGRERRAEGLTNRQPRTPNGLSAFTPHSPLPTPASPTPHPSPSLAETVLVLETQIDDLNPQALGYVLEELLGAGALDVFTHAITMKKSRPGILLTVICRPEDQATCEAIVFRETTTLGIRCTRQERQILPRQIQVVTTPWGPVRVKLAWADGCDRPPTNVQPEYEDCAQLARRHHLAWRKVHQQTLQLWFQGQAQGQSGSLDAC